MRTLILDTETPGFASNPATGHPDIIELAYIDVTNTVPKALAVTQPENFTNFQQLYKPEQEISPQATEIHGYVNKDLEGYPSCREAKIEFPAYIICHNASFDYKALGKPEHVKTICTLSIIKAICKFRKDIELENHKLDTVYKYFFPNQPIEVNKTAFHSAMGDCKKLYFFLTIIVSLFPKLDNWEALYNFQDELKKLPTKRK